MCKEIEALYGKVISYHHSTKLLLEKNVTRLLPLTLLPGNEEESYLLPTIAQ